MTLGAGSLVLCASQNVVDDPVEVQRFRAELEREAEALGCSLNVHFLDFSRDAIGRAYRSADLVWNPTVDEEPLGLVPIEAMASGVPVVVTRSGGMNETVRHMETGLLVTPGDAEELGNAALSLLSQEALRSKLVARAQSWSGQFDNDEYVLFLEGLYEQTRARCP